jgi:hypothetical protein
MHGNRAIFIAQDGVDLLRMVPGNTAQRIAVIATDAVRDVATCKVTDTITSPREKLPVTLLIPLEVMNSSFQNRGGRPFIHGDFTCRRRAKIQRLRFSSGDSCAWKRVPRRDLPSHRQSRQDGCRPQ